MSSALSNHPLNVEIPPNFPLVMTDAILIAQVLENLLDNACKYSAPMSPITISVRFNEIQMEIAVRDHGIGIPTSDLERVFDKFYRVQRQESIAGTGLGLSICKGIIEAHGGRIWAANNADNGVSITFTLPLSNESMK
jgi:two-component system sensor histidine kinase KdpD